MILILPISLHLNPIKCVIAIYIVLNIYKIIISVRHASHAVAYICHESFGRHARDNSRLGL